MIDPHVHLRDWAQSAKETLRHGLTVAYRAGLDGVFEMPNTDPPLTSRDAVLRRIDDADAAIAAAGVRIFHGLCVGLTAVPRQIEEAVRMCRDLRPRVVGLKMFAGHSTGNMGIVDPREQALVYRTLAALGYTGVLAVHCEKEALLRPAEWDPSRPASHGRARPPAAEVASVDDQLTFARAAGFRGTLHVCHISTPWALDVLRGTHAGGASSARAAGPAVSSAGQDGHAGVAGGVEQTRLAGPAAAGGPAGSTGVAESGAAGGGKQGGPASPRDPSDAARSVGPAAAGAASVGPAPGLRLTCGLTPHHALLDIAEMDEPDGIVLKVNPPLRPAPMPSLMLQRLFDGDIDWIETDHAPHTRADKLEKHASGFPGLPFFPRFVKLLTARGMSAERIGELTHDAICRVFDVDILASGRAPETGLEAEYELNAWKGFAG